MCRVYARYIMRDKTADLVIRFLWGLYFWKVHRYWPRLRNPISFEEKVSCRMLFDRDPRWTMIADKWRVRDYVANKVGSEYLVPLLWHGGNPEDIPFNELPIKFVIKTNHGCKYTIIVKDKTQLDQKKTRRQLKKWLNENFCQDKFLGLEWAYKNIRPTIIIESFLADDSGNVPVDYKFFCYAGQAEFLQMNFDRFGDPYEKFFDRDFNALDLWNGTKQYPGEVVRPNNYESMICLAESLAQGFDFIRVDLYSVCGQIYFGELTCYPSGGMTPFVPETYDFLFGEKWKYQRESNN